MKKNIQNIKSKNNKASINLLFLHSIKKKIYKSNNNCLINYYLFVEHFSRNNILSQHLMLRVTNHKAGIKEKCTLLNIFISCMQKFPEK